MDVRDRRTGAVDSRRTVGMLREEFNRYKKAEHLDRLEDLVIAVVDTLSAGQQEAVIDTWSSTWTSTSAPPPQRTKYIVIRVSKVPTYPLEYQVNADKYPALADAVEDEYDVFIVEDDNHSNWWSAREFFRMVNIDDFMA